MPSAPTGSTLAGDDPGARFLVQERLTPSAYAAATRAAIAAKAASDKKGADIVVLDVGEIISITEMFVLASATNTRQVKTIAEEVERALKELDGRGPRSVEGLDDATWVLMDFGDVIVHVFLAETREYYDLDRLWSDAPVVTWENAVAAQSGAAESR